MLEKLKPLRDCLLIRRLPTETQTAGGIYLPETKDDRSQIGRVIAAGTGRLTPEGDSIPLQVKKDDLVFFGKFAGTDAGKDLLILKEEDVLGVIDQSDAKI